MTLRRLRTAVCLLAVLSIGTTVIPAWAADHDADNCAAGGSGGGSGGGGGGGGGSGGSGGDGGGGSGSGGSGSGGAGGASGGGSSGGSSGASSGSAGSAGSSGGAAAASSVGVGPAANSVAPAHNGGVGLSIRPGIGGVGNGGGGNGGGIDAGGDASGATSLQGARPYLLRAIYFRRDQFRSSSDCLTAAYTHRLPLEVCQ